MDSCRFSPTLISEPIQTKLCMRVFLHSTINSLSIWFETCPISCDGNKNAKDIIPVPSGRGANKRFEQSSVYKSDVYLWLLLCVSPSLIPASGAQILKWISAPISQSHYSSCAGIIYLPQAPFLLIGILLTGFTLFSQGQTADQDSVKWSLAISSSPSLPCAATCLILI